MNTEQVETEVADETTIPELPELNAERTAEWVRVRGLLTDAQANLTSFFDKLEVELGNGVKIRDIVIERSKRPPITEYSWSSDAEWEKFIAQHPEAGPVFANRIDNVMIVINFDK